MKMSSIREEYKASAKSGWFTMDNPGNYRVRVVTELFPLKRAPFKPGDNPRTVFLCRVIDREDGKLKLWAMTYSIKDQYAALSQDPDYSFDDFPTYDIKIQKISTGPEKQNVKYQIMPSPVSSLTQEELQLVADSDDLGPIVEKLQKLEAEKMGLSSQRMITEGDPDYVDPDKIPF